MNSHARVFWYRLWKRFTRRLAVSTLNPVLVQRPFCLLPDYAFQTTPIKASLRVRHKVKKRSSAWRLATPFPLPAATCRFQSLASRHAGHSRSRTRCGSRPQLESTRRNRERAGTGTHRRAGHQSQMQRPRVATQMQRAVLDQGRELHQAQFSGKHPPGRTGQLFQQQRHLGALAFGGRAGEDDSFIRPARLQPGHEFEQLCDLQLLAVVGGEWAEMEVRPGVGCGNARRLQMRRLDFDMEFQPVRGEPGLFQQRQFCK